MSITGGPAGRPGTPPQTTAPPPPANFDWDALDKVPWKTYLGDFERAAETNRTCLGAPDSERCQDLKRLMTHDVTEAQVRSTIAAINPIGTALTNIWTRTFAAARMTYVAPELKYYGWTAPLFGTPTMPPLSCLRTPDNAFYCPETHDVYLDVVFLARLQKVVADSNGTSGGYASMTVVAHEVGHAVDRQLGLTDPTTIAGRYRGEMLADCFAGAVLGDVVRRKAGGSQAVLLIQSIEPLGEGQVAMFLLGGRQMADAIHEDGQMRANFLTWGFRKGFGECQAVQARRNP
ncbi:MAG: neutral zinc metallopeptidase [Vicinamibacterales bacterium]